MSDTGITPGLNPAFIKAFLDTTDYIKAHYGYMAQFLDDPEIGGAIRQAAMQGLDMHGLAALVQQTDWFKKQSDAQRAWIALNELNPGEATSRNAATSLAVRVEASKLGLSIDPARVAQIANDANKFGWTPQQLQQAIAAEFHYDPNKAQSPNQFGDIQANMAKIKALAADYMITFPDSQIADWAKKLSIGEMNIDGLTAYAQQLAAGKFPALKGALDQGITPQQYFGPYRTHIANILEVTPDSIDFNSPKYGPVMTTYDSTTKMSRPMTLSEADTWARSQPEYDHTQGAMKGASAMALEIGARFGATTS